MTKIKNILYYILCGIIVLLTIPIWLIALGVCLALLFVFTILGFFTDLFADFFN